MSPDRLAYMANQIARFFAHCPEDVAIAEVAEHLRKFWDPRMRSQIIAMLAEAEKLPLAKNPLVTVVQKAVATLRT